ncbi:MAG TPA: superinfection immunity protein [Mucilaginibacter sp.]|nr:superinfection immunity protein [Mucilaginibacter sp.]
MKTLTIISQAPNFSWNQSLLSSFMFLLLGACLYMLPTILARGKKNILSIAALNFFLGWTLLGWVGALIWALYKEDK